MSIHGPSAYQHVLVAGVWTPMAGGGGGAIIVTPSDLLFAKTTFAASGVVSAVSAVLVGMTVRSNSGAVGYLFVWNAAAVPGGLSTIGPYRIPPNTEVSIGFDTGIRFGTGICWAHSTLDDGAYAIGGANFLVTTAYHL